MEEQGYIEIKFESLIGNTPIKPNDLDIAEIKEIISDVETFLYPSRGEKAERPHISYNIEEGSVRNLFYLPISGVLLFNGLAGEINNRGNIDFLDSKRALIIDKFQRKANEKNLEISFYSSSDIKPILKINRETKFFKIAATQIETEFVLYKQNLADGKPFDLKLIDYITYNPNYNEHKLDLLIERASVKWNTIPNVDVWLNEIRG